MKDSLIMHIDGDAFFASCEVSRRPDLKGKPVVVGEDKGIASALTYEAKKLGVYRGMPIFEIKREFPEVVTLSSHFELYEEFQYKLISILKSEFHNVEAYSIDECFVQIPNLKRQELEELISKLKYKIQTSLGITYSFGISKTKTLAKIASKMNKPNGCVYLINQDEIDKALENTLVGSVWGVGRKISASLISLNIKTAKDFLKFKLSELENMYNLPVIQTYYELSGKRIFNVGESSDTQKTIQATRSIERSTTDGELLFSELSRNIENACTHMRSSNLFTNCIHIYYRQAFQNKVRNSITIQLIDYTDNPIDILRQTKPYINQIFKKNTKYKSTGVSLLNLRSSVYITNNLFDKTPAFKKTYMKDIDKINKKFGQWTIMCASSLDSVIRRMDESKLRDRKDNYEYNLPFPYMGEVY